jgi:tRNA threonylcarbamoyladenosine biosynthesis protein TsaB
MFLLKFAKKLMLYILNIETSTDICSVSIAKNGICIDVLIDNPNLNGLSIHGQHSKILAVLIDRILNKNDIKIDDIDAIAISEGPGSYTGLRIGVSTAKGICLGANKPLITINTLRIIAEMAVNKIDMSEHYIVPMIDARRMEVYCSVYDNNLIEIESTSAKIIEENSFENFSDKKLLFCGNGSDKCKTIIKNPEFRFLDGVFPSAEYMSALSYQFFEEGNFADLIYFEPFYLKSFVATTPKKLL